MLTVFNTNFRMARPIKLERTPVQFFMEKSARSTEQEARQFLGGFGLVGGLALQLIGTLSGGQKARLVVRPTEAF